MNDSLSWSIILKCIKSLTWIYSCIGKYHSLVRGSFRVLSMIRFFSLRNWETIHPSHCCCHHRICWEQCLTVHWIPLILFFCSHHRVVSSNWRRMHSLKVTQGSLSPPQHQQHGKVPCQRWELWSHSWSEPVIPELKEPCEEVGLTLSLTVQTRHYTDCRNSWLQLNLSRSCRTRMDLIQHQQNITSRTQQFPDETSITFSFII